MYIKRFAAKLDLGSKTNAVCMTALKVRPAGRRHRLSTPPVGTGVA